MVYKTYASKKIRLPEMKRVNREPSLHSLFRTEVTGI